MTESYDVIILGAGVMGSSAAYHLAKAGHRILLLEQFEVDHQKGSSYGYSRIIRYAYDRAAYIQLMKAAYPLWAELQMESGDDLFTKTGGIDFGCADQVSLHNTINALSEADITHEVWSPDEAQKHFPQFRFDEDMKIIYQADTGILAASKCVRAAVRLAEQHSATIRTNAPVTRINVHPNSVEVQTASHTYIAARLIITAGSWAKSLLGSLGLDLPLTPVRCQEMYFETNSPEDYLPDRFPAFIGHLKSAYHRMPYGLASQQDSGLKITFHGGQPVNHPSETNYTPDEDEIERGLQFASRYLPNVTVIRSTRICLYTMTPDENFLIDKHPEYPHVVFGGGFSGHGFKFGMLIGKILMELALNGETSNDISLFRVSRFL
jgi:monomeric sarcosine oxidase